MKKMIWVLGVVAACTPSVQSAKSGEGGDGGAPCEVADALTQERMIALPDGAAMQVPCVPIESMTDCVLIDGFYRNCQPKTYVLGNP
jgi:hypothetical protein